MRRRSGSRHHGQEAEVPSDSARAPFFTKVTSPVVAPTARSERRPRQERRRAGPPRGGDGHGPARGLRARAFRRTFQRRLPGHGVLSLLLPTRAHRWSSSSSARRSAIGRYRSCRWRRRSASSVVEFSESSSLQLAVAWCWIRREVALSPRFLRAITRGPLKMTFRKGAIGAVSESSEMLEELAPSGRWLPAACLRQNA